MSEKAKHTPGPWIAHGPVVTANGSRIAQTHFGDNCDADARLIAAAPYLLAACKRMVGYYQAGHLSEFNGAMNQMVDAIAKAEGVTS